MPALADLKLICSCAPASELTFVADSVVTPVEKPVPLTVTVVDPVFAVRSVVMYVDYGLQSGFFGIADYLRDPVQPGLVNLVFRSFPDVSKPGDRNPHRAEAEGLDPVWEKSL